MRKPSLLPCKEVMLGLCPGYALRYVLYRLVSCNFFLLHVLIMFVFIMVIVDRSTYKDY